MQDVYKKGSGKKISPNPERKFFFTWALTMIALQGDANLIKILFCPKKSGIPHCFCSFIFKLFNFYFPSAKLASIVYRSFPEFSF